MNIVRFALPAACSLLLTVAVSAQERPERPEPGRELPAEREPADPAAIAERRADELDAALHLSKS